VRKNTLQEPSLLPLRQSIYALLPRNNEQFSRRSSGNCRRRQTCTALHQSKLTRSGKRKGEWGQERCGRTWAVTPCRRRMVIRRRATAVRVYKTLSCVPLENASTRLRSSSPSPSSFSSHGLSWQTFGNVRASSYHCAAKIPAECASTTELLKIFNEIMTKNFVATFMTHSVAYMYFSYQQQHKTNEHWI